MLMHFANQMYAEKLENEHLDAAIKMSMANNP
jgi:hypothetical protein